MNIISTPVAVREKNCVDSLVVLVHIENYIH